MTPQGVMNSRENSSKTLSWFVIWSLLSSSLVTQVFFDSFSRTRDEFPLPEITILNKKEAQGTKPRVLREWLCHLWQSMRLCFWKTWGLLIDVYWGQWQCHRRVQSLLTQHICVKAGAEGSRKCCRGAGERGDPARTKHKLLWCCRAS